MLDVDRIVRRIIINNEINPEEVQTIKTFMIDQINYNADPITVAAKVA